MIIKSFQLEKIDIRKNNFFLFYGENQGHKSETIEKLFKKKFSKNIYLYEENEILKNPDNFLNSILTKSFFENEKLIIINRSSDKIHNIIEELIQKKIEDLVYSDNKLIEATIYGLKRCDNFSWANCATKTLKVYEELYN